MNSTRCPECKGKGRIDTPPRIAGDWIMHYKDCQHCLGKGHVLSENIYITARGTATVKRRQSPKLTTTNTRRVRWWHLIRRGNSPASQPAVSPRNAGREVDRRQLRSTSPINSPFSAKGRSSASVHA